MRCHEVLYVGGLRYFCKAKAFTEHTHATLQTYMQELTSEQYFNCVRYCGNCGCEYLINRFTDSKPDCVYCEANV